ncbi:lactate racemase domain-containing protein [Fictibacillus enclensis]|uniref:lactate racemase domain-containing protein n=1 Tax=Fictibacillus enclensis TaxID=1017270 RepID=UPI0025A118DE|nr:lactate racemase domain-containing protein [Fictibacillus enclensis]MDM5340222.1 lactate racemase domain-containing protein [Fictibacillus enclensis]
MAVLESGFDFEGPAMFKVQQHFDDDKVNRDQIHSVIRDQFHGEPIKNRIRPGMKIAVAVGSRGIRHIDFIVHTVIDLLHEFGAKPFIVPAMASHGGGEAEGQRKVLGNYGITEETMGAPINASMETIDLGTVDGVPVYFSKTAFESDLIIPVCRIKPHTDFKGPIESGIYKMLCIGLGKHKGASTIHSAGYAAFPTLIPNAGQLIIDNAPVGLAVSVVENSYDEVENVYVIPKELIPTEEPKLLQKAKHLMAKINIDPIDLLIVDELGKNISGEGMDPNVTGRSPVPGVPFEGISTIHRIAVLDLTEETHGNATGIGMADLTTKRCFEKIDLPVTYANVLTAGLFESAKIPVMLENDREVVGVGLKSATLVPPKVARVVRIKNTLHLSEFWVSEIIAKELSDNPKFTVTNDIQPFRFNQDGNFSW